MSRPYPLRAVAAIATAVLAGAALASCDAGKGGDHPSTAAGPSSSAPAGCRAASCYVRPAQAGFTGDRGDLVAVPAEKVPDGCQWIADVKTLECRGDAVIDHMDVHGGIDAYGNLTITDSVISGNPTNWVLVNERSNSGHCTVTHSTLRFDNRGSYPAGMTSWGVAGINDMNGCRGDYRYNDISGTPDGIDTGSDGTVIRSNYIHDLAMFGTAPNETHNDGIQLFGCSGCDISYNTFDIGWDGAHQNACFFASDGNAGVAIAFRGNYLSGGGIAFRNQVGTRMTVVDNTFRPLPRQFGLSTTGPAASFAAWRGNVTTGGAPVGAPPPQ